MELVVLNEKFQRIFIIDDYESFMWIDRYNSPGEFELYATVTEDLLTYPTVNNYLYFDKSEHLMIIEDIAIDTNSTTGNHIKIVGRSLESILDRRIVWKQTTCTGELETCLKKLFGENIATISGYTTQPSGTEGNKRKISNFKFQASGDSYINDLTMDTQFTGDNLLDIVCSVCQEADIGFKIILDDNNDFVFSLYTGVDRSYDQDNLPYVVFSPSFENIISSNYLAEYSKYKNVALVAGEGEGSSRRTKSVGTTSGLLRKEMFVDARDLQSSEVSDYNKALTDRGKEKLAENKVKREFDGKCETSNLYVYDRDFHIGDILQVSNEYGMESPSRIVEFIWNHSSSGLEAYPTFAPMDEEE